MDNEKWKIESCDYLFSKKYRDKPLVEKTNHRSALVTYLKTRTFPFK